MWSVERASPIPYGLRVHATELEEMDVGGILRFAERVLPRGSARANGYRRLRSRLSSLGLPTVALEG